MKKRKALYPIAATLVAAAFALPALAQPRPEPPRPRPAPPAGERPMPGRPMPPNGALAAHDAAVAHDAAARQESADEIRARMQKRADDQRAKRDAERKNQAKWNADRTQRADEWRNDMAKEWGNELDLPEARTELNLHSDRMSRLNRILDIAEDKHDAALTAHCRAVIQKEVARDARIMATLRAKERR